MSSEHPDLTSCPLAQVYQQLSPVARNEAVAIHMNWSYHTTLVPDALLLGIAVPVHTVTTVSEKKRGYIVPLLRTPPLPATHLG